MNLKNLVAAVLVIGFTVSSTVVWGAEKEELRLADVGGIIVPLAPMSSFVPQVQRPAVLPALYVTLGAMQAWDIYSTRAALAAGAHEANATAAPFARGAISGLSLSTFYFLRFTSLHLGSIASSPPMYDRSASGTTTVPSFC